jgi:hypothetical protein
LNNVCTRAPANEGATCDDGLFCTDFDVCTMGTCKGTPKTCPPTSECTVGTCDETTKACGTMPGNDGAPCKPANDACVQGACSGGACAGAQPMSCSYLDEICAVGSCDAMQGCVKKPITTCTSGDGCCPSGCTPATDSDCSCSVDLALAAIGTISGGGGGPWWLPSEMNDGIGKSHCDEFSWIANNATPSGAFWQLDWPSPVTIASLYIEATNADGTGQCPSDTGRNIASADVQWWNGWGWATAFSFSGKSGDVQIDLPQPVVTKSLRLFDVTAGAPSICGAPPLPLCNGNSIMYEWHVFNTPGCIPPPD